MRDLNIFIGNGVSEYQLHSLSSWLPSLVQRPMEGLDNPSMRLDAYDNPGIPGQTVGQALPGASIITLSGFLRTLHGMTENDAFDSYFAERNKFQAALTHRYNALGRALPLILRLQEQDGKEYRIEVYKERFSAERSLPLSNPWYLQLRNPRGVVEEATEHSATVTLPQPGGVLLRVNTKLPFKLGASSGGRVTINCRSSIQTFPRIRINGPIQHPTLINTTVGERLQLAMNLSIGEFVDIDMQQQLVLQGGVNDRFSAVTLNSRFWALQPGLNDILLRANTYQSGSATLRWHTNKEGI